MAIGDAYATRANYKLAFSKTATGQDALIDDELIGISRWIDRHPLVRRHFTKDDAVVTRSFYPKHNGPKLLLPFDVASKTNFALKVDTDRDGSFADETAWTIDTHFQLLPLDADIGPEARPWTEILIPEWSTKGDFRTDTMVQVVSITGWPAVPKIVTRLTMEVLAVLRLESPRATERVPESIDDAIGLSEVARTLLDQVIRDYGRGPAWVY